MTTEQVLKDPVQRAIARAGWFVPRRGRGAWLLASGPHGLTAYRALASGADCHVRFEHEADAEAFRELVASDQELDPSRAEIRVGDLHRRDGEPDVFDVVVLDELAAHASPLDLIETARVRVAKTGRLGLAVNLADSASLASYVLSALRQDFAPIHAQVIGSEFYLGLERSGESAERWSQFDREHTPRILTELLEHERLERSRLEALVRAETERAAADNRTALDLLKAQLALDEARNESATAAKRAEALEARALQNDELVRQVEALRREKTRGESELIALREELKVFETLKSEVSVSLGDSNLAAGLVSGLSSMASKVADLSVELNRTKTDALGQVRALESERDELAARLDAEVAARDNVEREVIRIETRLSSMQSNQDGLDALIEQLKETLSDAERAQVRAESEMSDKAARLEVEAEVARDQTRALEGQLSEALTTLEDARSAAIAEKRNFDEALAQLQAELNQASARLADREAATKGADSDSQKVRAELRETQTRLDQLQKREAAAEAALEQRLADIARIEGSIRYRLGSRIVETAKSMLGVVGFRRFRAEGQAAPAKVRRSSLEQADGLPDLTAPTFHKPKLAIVADEFTTSCFRPDVDLVPLDIEGFANQIRTDKPDLVMVESAWAGNQGSWHYRIAKYNRSMGEELRDMLAVADEAKVPSVFWNKEDPVHFERFIDSAKKCDVILTTDDQCVPRYIAESGKNRVDAMPFAAQPAIHNPLGSESRLNNPCFAGTYYGSRHQQRGADMMHLLKPAVDFDLHIYDRRYGYAGKDADQFRFPDIFQPCIQGKLAYDEMTRAYKRYRSFLNVNSVTTSQTMFSRRVFELLACGTPVISSYSAGIEHLLGDVVFISNSESETRAALETLSDDEAWAKVSLAGMRRVFAEHTYEHRLGFMFEKAGLKRPAARQASFIAMARVETAEQVARVRDHLDIQSFKPKAVFVISDSLTAEDLQSLSAAAGQAPLRHFTSQVELRDLADLLNTFTGAYIVRFDAGRGYGRHYLSDLKDALLYTQPAFFGRHSYYVTGASDTLKLTNPGWEHRHATGAPGASVAARCGELSASSVRDVMFKTWFRVPDGRDLVSLSRYGFVDHHPEAPQVPLHHRPVRDALELG